MANQSTFPTTLDGTPTDRTSGDSVPSEDWNQYLDAIDQLETKVGVNNSAITSSLDYRVRQKWFLQADGYTATPASTSTITTTSDLSALFVTGRPIKYKIGGTYYYGIVTAITTALITIAGAPMGGDLQELFYGWMSNVVQFDFVINGYFEDADDTTLLANDLRTSVKWQLGTAYLVKFSVIEKTVDSGAEPFVNADVNGAIISTSNTNAGLTAAATWVDTVVDINTSNYDINYGESIEVRADKQGNGDAQDLTVSMVFVIA